MRTSFLTLAVVLPLAFSACGKRSKTVKPKINLPLELQYAGSGDALNLAGEELQLMGAAVNDFKINVSGCKSGFAPAVVSTTAAPQNKVALYRGDVGCVAGLLEFTFAGKVYQKVGGGELTTGTGVFVSGASQMNVTATEQLNSPLTAAGRAQFSFLEIRQGNDNTPVAANYSEGHDLMLSGVEAPNFEISRVELSGIGATAGEPSYLIKFECQKSLVAKACPTEGGSDQLVSAMDVKVVKDATAGVLTFEEAEALFATPGATGTDDAAIGTHGGLTATVAGPGPLYTNRETLVVIRYSSGSGASYRYFNMDIGEPAL